MSLFKIVKNTVNNNISNASIRSMLMLQGRMYADFNKQKNSLNIQDYEFKVFSQCGDDGIIQYLINKIPINNKTFIEFGVENYNESNTRFLLQNNNWSGLIIDGSDENIKYIKKNDLYWMHDLKAVSAFITKDNINDLIKNADIEGEIGILSVDIDGNDYWVWDAIDCVEPQIVIVEYNSLFGDEAKITVPYDENFRRNDKHYSNLYFGASISAINILADKKGYFLVGSNTVGNNLFFVKKEYISDIKVLTPKEAYVKSKFRESRDESGNLTYLSHKDGLILIQDLPVYDVEKGQNFKIKDV